MNILNDTEHRLFLSAMQREKKVCEQFDNSGDSGIKLLPICRNIERKVDKAIAPRKGKWLRMSDLSEQEDDRYECSRCGNVIHHKNEMNLYTFNSWCGRCGSDNGRHINYEVE